MTKFVLSLTGLAMLALLHHSPAHAAPTKVWVSSNGTDSSTCGPVNLPCKTFQQAHDNVASGGEIGVLNAGDYGRVNISKAVDIINDGSGEASIVNTNGALAAITISAGVGDVVGLRGLVLNGAVAGADGIDVNNVGALHMQNCVIRNFEGAFGARGIIVTGNSGTTRLFITDTIISNNGAGASSGGIWLASQGGRIEAVLNRVQLENNVFGLKVSSTNGAGFAPGVGAHVIVRDSVISGNAGDGIVVSNTAGGTLVLVEHTTVVNNAGNGIIAQSPSATVLLNDATISRNGTGISAVNGGQLISYGNNKNNNNLGAEGAPTGFYNQM